MTIYDTTFDKFYTNKLDCLNDLADAINYEILDLVKNGQTVIQIDEPLFARLPDDANEFGIEIIEKCFRNVPESVFKIVHMCCGYPNYLDEPDYKKAHIDSYQKIIKKIDDCKSIDAVSLEDAHRYNDLSLFK